MDKVIRVLGLCGSLRRNSYNMRLLELAGELMLPRMKLEIASLADIPMFNQDVMDEGMPLAVTQLRARIAAADGILLASPEYNASMSAALKNAIDWSSRQPSPPFTDKPVALISATVGPAGGAGAQHDLRKVLGLLGAFVLPRPEVMVGLAQNKFDASGRLLDEGARALLGQQMTGLRAWILRVRAIPTSV